MDSSPFGFASEPSVWLLASRGQEVLAALVSGSAHSRALRDLYSYRSRDRMALYDIYDPDKLIFNRTISWR